MARRRLSQPKKKKADDIYKVDRAWERRTEPDGSYRYLTSWAGYAEKTWEPIEHFTDGSVVVVRELEAILDDPANNPKPDWLLDFEDQKARGMDVVKRTPGYKDRKGGKKNGVEIKVEVKEEIDDEDYKEVEKKKEIQMEIKRELLEEGQSTSAAVMTTPQPSIAVQIPQEMPTTRIFYLSSPTTGHNLVSPIASGWGDNLFDSAGILLPLDDGSLAFDAYNWFAYLEKEGGVAAPREAFWTRHVGQFINRFGAYIGGILKMPDFDEDFNFDWCTVGTVKDVHGPWVKVHALDTDPALARWMMADDAFLQPFIALSNQTVPKCKEPINRRNTGQYKRLIDKSVFDINGADLRVPAECFEGQLSWKNRPMKNLFQVGHKLETYDPERGEGCFYPATVVDVNAVKDTIKVHYDGYPESQTKQVSYNDPRLFPCGFASAIGWKCILPEGIITKKQENRGRKKVPLNNPTITIKPVGKTQQATNVNEDVSVKDEEDGGRVFNKKVDAFASLSLAHTVRAPAIPGLQKLEEPIKKDRVKKKAVRRMEPPTEPPARQLSPLRMEDFDEGGNDQDQTFIPITQIKYTHTGHQVRAFLNHRCQNGPNICPQAFQSIPSKHTGSVIKVFREVLQQLLNASYDSVKFHRCLPAELMSQEGGICITYDETATTCIVLQLVPPPNLAHAKKTLAGIMQRAGMCPNAVCWDTRIVCPRCREPEENNEYNEFMDHQLMQQQMFRQRYSMNAARRQQGLPVAMHRPPAPQRQRPHHQQGQQMYRHAPSSSTAMQGMQMMDRPSTSTAHLPTVQLMPQQHQFARPGTSTAAVMQMQNNGQPTFPRGTTFTIVPPSMLNNAQMGPPRLPQAHRQPQNTSNPSSNKQSTSRDRPN